LVDSLANVERDGLLAAEGQRRKIRLEPDVVPGRHRRTGQTMGIHDVLRTRMSAAPVLYRDTASSPTLTPRLRRQRASRRGPGHEARQQVPARRVPEPRETADRLARGRLRGVRRQRARQVVEGRPALTVEQIA